MSVLVEPIVRPCPETEGDDSDAERTPRVARHQRPGGLRLGHGLRRADPALSRPARRRAARSARPDDDAQPAQRAARPARRRSFAPSASRRSSAGRSPTASGRLAEFRLEAGLPVWRYEVGGVTLEKRLLLPHLQNTVYVTYRLIEGDGRGATGPSAPAHLRPLVHFRSHDAPVDSPHPGPYRFTAWGDRYEISTRRRHPAAAADPGRPRPGVHARRRADDARSIYRLEAQRGYESTGDLWSPASSASS